MDNSFILNSAASQISELFALEHEYLAVLRYLEKTGDCSIEMCNLSPLWNVYQQRLLSAVSKVNVDDYL